MKWKSWMNWAILFLVSLGYAYLKWSTDPVIAMENSRRKMAEIADEHNSEIQIKENRITEFYRSADSDLSAGLAYMDSILEADRSLSKWDRSYFHTIAGETLYDKGKIKEALERFELAELISISSPRTQANKAGCYVKMGDYETAMNLLKQAAGMNEDNKWYIGNLYEVMNDREKAMEVYRELYQKNTTVYQYCGERVQELKNPNPTLFTELIYRDQRERLLIWFKKIDPNSPGLNLIKFELEKKGNSTQ